MSNSNNPLKRSHIFDQGDWKSHKDSIAAPEFFELKSNQLSGYPSVALKTLNQENLDLNARTYESQTDGTTMKPSNNQAYSTNTETESSNKESVPTHSKVQLTLDMSGNYSGSATAKFLNIAVDPLLLNVNSSRKSPHRIFSNESNINQGLEEPHLSNPTQRENTHPSFVFKPTDSAISSNAKPQICIDFTEHEPLMRPQDPSKYQSNILTDQSLVRKDDSYISHNPTPANSEQRRNVSTFDSNNPINSNAIKGPYSDHPNFDNYSSQLTTEPSYQRTFEQNELISNPFAQHKAQLAAKSDGTNSTLKSAQSNPKIHVLEPQIIEKGVSEDPYSNRTSVVSQALEFIQTTPNLPQNISTNQTRYAALNPSSTNTHGRSKSGNASNFRSLLDGTDLKQSIYLEESKNIQNVNPPERARLREKNCGQLTKSVIDVKYELPEWYEKDKDTNLYETMYLIDAVRNTNERTIHHLLPAEGEKSQIQNKTMDHIQQSREQRRQNPLNLSQKLDSPKSEKKWDKHIARVILFVQKYNGGEMEDDCEDDNEIKKPKQEIQTQSSSIKDYLLLDLKHPKAKQHYGEGWSNFQHISVSGAQGQGISSEKQQRR